MSRGLNDLARVLEPDGTTIDIEMRRDGRFGDEDLKEGDIIATVHFRREISLNYLVDAVRNGFAHEVNE